MAAGPLGWGLASLALAALLAGAGCREAEEGAGERLGGGPPVLAPDGGAGDLGVVEDARVDLPPPPEPGRLVVATYNVFNLFDLVDDPAIDEGEYTPGPQWGAAQLSTRLSNTAEVFKLIGADVTVVNEVENEGILLQLRDAIRRAGGPDYRWHALHPGRGGRGIDVGLLSRFPITQTLNRPISLEHECQGEDGPVVLDGSRPEARSILQADVDLDGDGVEDVVFLGNHWKAKGRSSFPCDDAQHRIRAARQARLLVDELLQARPERTVVVLGDFNAFEFEAPMRLELDAGLDRENLRPEELFNVWGDVPGVEDGRGNSNQWNSNSNSSYAFFGDWTRLDHIVISQGGRWAYEPGSAGNVSAPFLFDENGFPDAWRGGRGYSDHLPVRCALRLQAE